MRKILVVEDEDILRETYELILSTEPYIIDTARNGQEALEACKTKRYDLILLDIMMPVMDGIAFLKSIQDLDIGNPKIILLSNLSTGTELENALRLGAQTNILKSSISPKQLLTTVRYEVEAV
jgi:CheY-like chemotaxis protein